MFWRCGICSLASAKKESSSLYQVGSIQGLGSRCCWAGRVSDARINGLGRVQFWESEIVRGTYRGGGFRYRVEGWRWGRSRVTMEIKRRERDHFH